MLNTTTVSTKQFADGTPIIQPTFISQTGYSTTRWAKSYDPPLVEEDWTDKTCEILGYMNVLPVTPDLEPKS